MHMRSHALYGLPAHDPFADPVKEAQRQAIMQAIMPLGQQMTSIGLSYQESGGQYLLMSSDFYDSSLNKKAAVGAAVGAVAGATLLMLAASIMYERR